VLEFPAGLFLPASEMDGFIPEMAAQLLAALQSPEPGINNETVSAEEAEPAGWQPAPVDSDADDIAALLEPCRGEAPTSMSLQERLESELWSILMARLWCVGECPQCGRLCKWQNTSVANPDRMAGIQ
jgi:hypothetical protein